MLGWTTFSSLLLLLFVIEVLSDDVTTEENIKNETSNTPAETRTPAQLQADRKQPEHKSFVGRYIQHDKIYNTTFESYVKNLDNGTKLFEKRTKSELIEITTNVPDDENFVVSKITYSVYGIIMHQLDAMNQLNARNARNRTLAILATMQKLLHGEFKNKLLTKEIKGVLEKQYRIAKNITFRIISGRENIPNSEIKAYFERLVDDISTRPIPPRTKTLVFNQVNELISNKTKNKTIHGKKEYTGLLIKIVHDLLQNENNGTLVGEIAEKCNKAFEMNKHVQNRLKDKIFKMVIRALSGLNYRIINSLISKVPALDEEYLQAHKDNNLGDEKKQGHVKHDEETKQGHKDNNLGDEKKQGHVKHDEETVQAHKDNNLRDEKKQGQVKHDEETVQAHKDNNLGDEKKQGHVKHDKETSQAHKDNNLRDEKKQGHVKHDEETSQAHKDNNLGDENKQGHVKHDEETSQAHKDNNLRDEKKQGHVKHDEETSQAHKDNNLGDENKQGHVKHDEETSQAHKDNNLRDQKKQGHVKHDEETSQAHKDNNLGDEKKEGHVKHDEETVQTHKDNNLGDEKKQGHVKHDPETLQAHTDNNLGDEKKQGYVKHDEETVQAHTDNNLRDEKKQGHVKHDEETSQAHKDNNLGDEKKPGHVKHDEKTKQGHVKHDEETSQAYKDNNLGDEKKQGHVKHDEETSQAYKDNNLRDEKKPGQIKHDKETSQAHKDNNLGDEKKQGHVKHNEESKRTNKTRKISNHLIHKKDLSEKYKYPSETLQVGYYGEKIGKKQVINKENENESETFHDPTQHVHTDKMEPSANDVLHKTDGSVGRKEMKENVEECPKNVKSVDPDERCNQMYVALTDEYELTQRNKDILAKVIKKYWTEGKVDIETKDYVWEHFQTAQRMARKRQNSKSIATGKKISKKSAEKEIKADFLKDTIRKHLKYNKEHCSQVDVEDQIKTIIIQAMEYQKTKNKLRSLYDKHIVKSLREGKIEKVKARLIEKYLLIKDKPVETKPIKINQADAKLMENFEKDLLNTIIRDKTQVRMNPKKTAAIIKIVSEKELDNIQHVSYFLIKTIIEELGYTVIDEDVCKAHQDCIRETKHLHEQYKRNDNIKYFNKYLERKLYDIKFATNLVHDKSDKALYLYKTFEREYTENSNCIKGLRRALVDKIKLYQKILRYSSLLKTWKKEEPCDCNNERKIVFNRNPIGNNTVIYRQNEFDMGYEISLSEPNKLIDASIITYINVDNRDIKYVKEAINNQPYVNLGDPLPGILNNYTTILKLEFISKKNHDITIQLGLVDKVVHSSYKIDMKFNGGLHVKGLIRLNGPRKEEYTYPDNMPVKWKVLNVKVDKFELRPDLSEVEDLEACDHYFQ